MPNLPVPSPRTFQVSEFETGGNLNSVRDALNFLLNPPRAVLVQNTTQSPASGVATPITFDGTVIDSYGGHSNSTNPSRYTAQVPGLYEVSGLIMWAANSTANRLVQVYVNGVVVDRTFSAFFTATAFNAGVSHTLGYVFLNAGDYVELWGTQNCGAALATFASSAARSVMNVIWKSVS